jgi:hypothetical protein
MRRKRGRRWLIIMQYPTTLRHLRQTTRYDSYDLLYDRFLMPVPDLAAFRSAPSFFA